MKLQGKVAIVTGGGRGIGKAIAKIYAKEGAMVVITARTERELDAAALEIRSDGGTVFAIRGDVSNSDDVLHVVSETISRFGRVDVLVNNAGLAGPPGNLDDMPEADWKRTIDTNVNGPFLFTKAVLPQMLKQRSGNIINVSSGAGEMRRRKHVRSIAYATSKFALEGFTNALSVRLAGTGVNVNSMKPGRVKSGLLPPMTAQEAQNLEKELGPEKDPEVVNDLALYLASLHPGELNGESLNIKDWNIPKPAPN